MPSPLGNEILFIDKLTLIKMLVFFILETADNLNSALITAEPQQNKTGFVMIKWKDPPNPNGPIIKYMIQYDKGGLSQVGKFL